MRFSSNAVPESAPLELSLETPNVEPAAVLVPFDASRLLSEGFTTIDSSMPLELEGIMLDSAIADESAGTKPYIVDAEERASSEPKPVMYTVPSEGPLTGATITILTAVFTVWCY